MRMRTLAVALLVVLLSAGAQAMPLLDLTEPAVLPGSEVAVTVIGQPGDHFALAASTGGSGFSVAGQPLQLGPDAQVVASGRLDARGRALVSLAPDFAGVDRLHLQAVTAASPAFDSFTSTPAKVLRNASLWLPVTTTTGGPAGLLTVSGSAPVPAAPAEGAGAPATPGAATESRTWSVAARAEAGPALGPAPRVSGREEAGPAWFLTGNAGTDPASQFLGTTDNQALELRVNSERALRLEPPGTADPIYGNSPRVLGGAGANSVAPLVVGATIAGGGALGGNCDGPGTPCPNVVTDNFGTVGGGVGNQAGDGPGTPVDAAFATVAGGIFNVASGSNSAVGGGTSNTASGLNATVAGGFTNLAEGINATVGGGNTNSATGERATIAGGRFNTAGGAFSTVPGGLSALAAQHGQLAYAAGRFVNDGDAQGSVYTLRATTTNANPTELTLDGAGARITLEPFRTMAFHGIVVARRNQADSAGFLVQGVIRNTGITALVGSSVTPLGANDPDWEVTLVGGGANEGLVINVTGDVSQTIRWVAVIHTAEVIH